MKNIFHIIGAFFIFFNLTTSIVKANTGGREETSALKMAGVHEEALYGRVTQAILAQSTSEDSSTATADHFLTSESDLCPEDACRSRAEVALQALDELSMSRNADTLKKVKNTALSWRKFIIEIGESLQLYVIYRQAGGSQSLDWEKQLIFKYHRDLRLENLSKKALYVLVSHPQWLSGDDWRVLQDLVLKRHKDQLAKPIPDIEGFSTTSAALDQHALSDLIYIEPPIDQYKSGRYVATPRIYMFCRQQRQFPCLMIMKNPDGSLRTTDDGQTLWSHPALGYSRHKKSYNQTNGNTPSGVFRIDSVMPEADQQFTFGKFRRLILNFVASTKNEEDHKKLLPESNHNLSWWREAVVARDIGRGLFRIHGTGLRSSSWADYFPLVPTSGCIAQRENRYRDVTYIDQRELLDELMVASGLEPRFENETKLRGLLYVVNIDNEERAVTLADLHNYGIHN